MKRESRRQNGVGSETLEKKERETEDQTLELPHTGLWEEGGRWGAETCAIGFDDMCFSAKILRAELTTGYRERLRNILSAVPSTLQKSYHKHQKNVFRFLGLS